MCVYCACGGVLCVCACVLYPSACSLHREADRETATDDAPEPDATRLLALSLVAQPAPHIRQLRLPSAHRLLLRLGEALLQLGLALLFEVHLPMPTTASCLGSVSLPIRARTCSFVRLHKRKDRSREIVATSPPDGEATTAHTAAW